MSILWLGALPMIAAATHPVEVKIAAIRGQGLPDGTPGGNVKVKLSNEKTELWANSGHCFLPRLSKSGLVGWTYASGRHSRGMWMNSVLRIARDGKVIREIEAGYAFIEIWDFSDNDSCVVIQSRNIHGPALVRKVCISSGQVLAEGSDAPGDYDWAKTYAYYSKVAQPCSSSFRLDRGPHNKWDAKLIAAVKDSEYVKVEEALRHGASANARDRDNETALIWAGNDLRMAELLLDHGADPNLADKEGTLPISHCQKDSDVEMAALLIKHGADLKRKNPDGQGPLLWAAWYGQLVMVKFLVEHGADVNAKDNFGQTPLSFAERQHQDAVLDYLKAHGAIEK
jgi:hypothetical protein